MTEFISKGVILQNNFPFDVWTHPGASRIKRVQLDFEPKVSMRNVCIQWCTWNCVKPNLLSCSIDVFHIYVKFRNDIGAKVSNPSRVVMEISNCNKWHPLSCFHNQTSGLSLMTVVVFVELDIVLQKLLLNLTEGKELVKGSNNEDRDKDEAND